MKGLEKLTCIRLAEVLTQKGAVPNDVITDALYAQERYGEAFVECLVTGGHVTEWDLAKLIVEHFQLPFLMASSYDVSEKAKTKFPREVLFRLRIVPIDVFDNVVTIAMPILTPYESLAKLKKEHAVHLFPYVGLISENRKVLGELFDDFADFLKQEERERERVASKVAAKGGQKAGNWMSIFDDGDAQVRDSLSR